MATPPALCGSFLGSKRSLVAFTWSVMTVLTLFAFLTAISWTIKINSHYRYLERMYGTDDAADNNNEHGEHNNNYYKSSQIYPLMASTSSRAMTFVALYTMCLSVALCLYGSTAIVGLTSLRGVYIAPCFSSSGVASTMKVGMFGGAIVIFANLLLLCAVIFGEFRVEDYLDDRQKEEINEKYAVERIATVLAVTCMFLSVLYMIFAVLLFVSYDEEDVNHHSFDKKLVHQQPGFITMEGRSDSAE